MVLPLNASSSSSTSSPPFPENCCGPTSRILYPAGRNLFSVWLCIGDGGGERPLRTQRNQVRMDQGLEEEGLAYHGCTRQRATLYRPVFGLGWSSRWRRLKKYGRGRQTWRMINLRILITQYNATL